MDNEQKEWRQQFWANFGAREYVRFACILLIWLFAGIALTIVFRNKIFVSTFFVTMFLFPFLTRWKPAFSLLRKILGNENLPMEPMPHSKIKTHQQPRPWYYYLPGIWGWLMLLLVLYIIWKR